MDPLVLAGSLLAVTLLIALSYGLRSRAVPLGDISAVTARYRDDFWQDDVQAVTLSTDGRAALLTLAEPHAVGLVAQAGHKSLTRRLTQGSIDKVTRHDDQMVSFRLVEFAGRRIRMLFDDELELARWHTRLAMMCKAKT